MKVKTVYQTLEDRGTDDADLIENGPYICKWPNTWLGDGYYFWDTFIENAHWWGKRRNFNGGYIICEAICDSQSERLFDLFGDLDHLRAFKSAFQSAKSNGKATKKTTAKVFLEFLRAETEFDFDAIRVNGMKSKRTTSVSQIFFEHNKPQHLELTPAVQICFFEKNSLNLRDFRINSKHKSNSSPFA